MDSPAFGQQKGTSSHRVPNGIASFEAGLRPWLSQLQQFSEIAHITAPVDSNLETSTLNYLVGKTMGSPALLFENLKGHPGARALYNMLGSSVARICLALGEQPRKRYVDAVRMIRDRMGVKIAPNVVSGANVFLNENVVNGTDVDLTMLPAPRMWPLDGGRYLGTGNVVLTMDPDNGRINVGTYRQMLQGKNRVTVYTSPGKDGGLDRQKWWAQGKPAPVAVIYGVDPALMMVGGQSFPKTESEYDYYGGMVGSPIKLFKSELTGLLLPTDAEIVAEGFFQPDDEEREGPFGEFTAYYGRSEGPCPAVNFERLRFRNNPILTCSLMADWPSNEAGLAYGILRSAKIWSDLDRMGVPGIKGVWTPPEAVVFGFTIVSVKQMYAGHASQVLSLAGQCMAGAYFTKYIIVVDDDVDPYNISDVLWAIATRSRPDQSIDILRETWSTYLDPSLNPPEIRPWGSKALINACMQYRYIDKFAPRSKLSRKSYEEVVRRWKEYGLPGDPPHIDLFEEKSFSEAMPLFPDRKGTKPK